jgi:hypothetical protein
MPPLRRALRRDPVAIALVAYDVWRRLPKKQRQQAVKLLRKHGPELVRKHGPQIAAKAFSGKKK